MSYSVNYYDGGGNSPLYTHTHTHTHTQIYIYIYIYIHTETRNSISVYYLTDEKDACKKSALRLKVNIIFETYILPFKDNISEP